jgi:hypothetical protein
MGEGYSGFPGSQLTPNGEKAVEQCPICGRLNNPGACDACVHFFGSYWDGEIIWSDQFNDFSEVWRALGTVTEQLALSIEKGWEELLQHVGTADAESKFERLDPADFSASKALMELVEFESGSRKVTDGMLSGEGHSLYLKSETVISQALSEIRLILEKLESLLRQ